MTVPRTHRKSKYASFLFPLHVTILLSISLTTILVTTVHQFPRFDSIKRTECQNCIPCHGKHPGIPSDKEASHSAGEMNYKKTMKLASLDYSNPRNSKLNLEMPIECREWRKIARKPSELRLYRKHFNSHDFADWFLYAAIFGEEWHSRRRERPRYLDIAANHARRWSTTWFFDRCLGWDGFCIEPNDNYWDELRTNRHCKLVDTCLSDRRRIVNFSLTDAFGGVVGNQESDDLIGRMGVNVSSHMTQKKNIFRGIKQLRCETLTNVVKAQGGGNRKSHFDFLSLDVEGHEFPILKGIDWDRISIDVIVVESRSPSILELLIEKDYEHYPLILKDDLWVKRGSNIFLDPLAVSWMKILNRSSASFPPGLLNASTSYVDEEESSDIMFHNK